MTFSSSNWVERKLCLEMETDLLLVPREARLLIARHSTCTSIIHTTYSETASVLVRNHNAIITAAFIYCYLSSGVLVFFVMFYFYLYF